MPHVIGIDLGTLSAYAVLDAFSGNLVSVHHDKAKTQASGRLLCLAANLERLCNQYDVELITCELPFGQHKRSLQVLYKMVGNVEALCKKVLCVPYAEAHLAHVKKHATGKGNAKKHEMQAAAKERWGGDYTEDEADALWVADYGRVHYL